MMFTINENYEQRWTELNFIKIQQYFPKFLGGIRKIFKTMKIFEQSFPNY